MLDEDRISGTPPPSWLPPILIGAFVTVAGSLLLSMLMPAGIPGVSTAAQCCCTLAFVPFGAVPAWLAFRRDPTLSAGQGFAVAFIAVGLGSVLWAGTMIASGPPPMDTQAIRRSFEEQQQKMPEDQRVAPEEIEETLRVLQEVWPYVPAIIALVLTLFGGLVGLITTSILASRARTAAGPPLD